MTRQEAGKQIEELGNTLVAEWPMAAAILIGLAGAMAAGTEEVMANHLKPFFQGSLKAFRNRLGPQEN